jgi:hypothetical protein
MIDKAINEFGKDITYVMRCVYYRDRGYCMDRDIELLPYLRNKSRMAERDTAEWYIYRGVLELVNEGVLEG